MVEEGQFPGRLHQGTTVRGQDSTRDGLPLSSDAQRPLSPPWREEHRAENSPARAHGLGDLATHEARALRNGRAEVRDHGVEERLLVCDGGLLVQDRDALGLFGRRMGSS